MKSKPAPRALSLALVLLLLVQLCAPAAAAADTDTIYLNNANALRSLAEKCAYDAWSEGKTVILQCDIALGGTDFLPIASFGGTFEGNGHTVSGLSVSANVSPAGLFGTVAETGEIRDLKVEGSVAPGGSADIVGGIAGINRGTLVGCSFAGTVNGEKRTGGIVGVNEASGAVRRCSVTGGVFGKNMTGGVVGENHGTVSMCVNRSYVNTNTIDPSLSFERLELGMTSGVEGLISPDIYNVTVDSGGVAGYSDGAMLGCRNYGSVGYQHIGYNVGGIAGRSSGHISSCVNDGKVYGRREVGGVVGVAEPYIKINVQEGAIERVRKELNTLSALINKTVSDAESASDTLSARLTAINACVDEAETSARALTDHMGDYVDSAVTEINRGSEIADVVIAQLRDVSQELTASADTLTEALDSLERAIGETELPEGMDGAAFAELSAMAGELRTSLEIISAGTKQIENGLSTLDRTVSPRFGMSEEEWRDLVYGERGPGGERTGGALGEVSDAMRETVSALGAVSSTLSGLSKLVTETTDEAKRDAQALYPDSPAQRAAYISGAGTALVLRLIPEYIAEHPLHPLLSSAGEGMRRAAAAMLVIQENTQVRPEAMTDGIYSIRAGLGTIADGRPGDGGGGAFDYMAGALGHLQNASAEAAEEIQSLQSDIDAAQRPLDELEKGTGLLRDASNRLTSALGGTVKLLEYLNNQDKLSFETLGEETDARADALYEAMHGISNNIELLNTEAKASTDRVLEDVRQISRQFTVMMNTLLDAVEEAEDAVSTPVVEDTSDKDVDAAVNGKVLLCSNTGEINGDIDVGGVAGAMMIFNKLDPESDTGSITAALHKRYELKCLLQDCENTGAVIGKRDNVGAVCGNASLGLISGCEAYGSAESEGDCVGGVAGYGDNTVRDSWSRCSLAGGKNVGGIVGGGKAERSELRVEDCRSLVEITRCTQYSGAIMGSEAGTLSGNLFVGEDLAGIDCVSVRGKAEPMEYSELLALAGLPERFRSFTLSFAVDGEAIRTVEFNYGDSFDASVFPELPEREGSFARWDRTELDSLRFDTTVNAVYEPCIAALASDVTRSSSRPTFLVEGSFDDTASAVASPAVYDYDDGESKTFLNRLRSYRKTLLEQWYLELPDDGAPTHTVRYLPPDGVSDHVELYVLENGAWSRLSTGRMGSYLTFETAERELELTVISTATPWWVWALVGGFAFFALALLLALIIRKKPKRALTEEEKKKEAVRKRRRRTVRIVLLTLALLLGGAAGAVLLYAPGLTDSMSLYMLLHNYAERSDLDMELSVEANVNGKTFDADVEYFTTPCADKRVSCVMWQDIPLYYCDGFMLLENGRSYRAEGVLPDYSKLLSHVAGLYRAVEVTAQETNGVKVYHAVARGEAAEQLLKAILPQGIPSVPDTETVQLELTLSDGEPTGLTIGWNGSAGDANASLRLTDEPGEHVLPQAVRTAISSGEYTDARSIDAQLKQLILIWTELSTRDPLSADVTLSADCGPLLVDEKLLWQRTFRYGKELSCVSRRGARIYYTDEAASTGTGVSVDRNGALFRDTARLLHLAYEAFLLGDAEYEETTAGARYTVRLDEAAMTQFAASIAPETKLLNISYEEGTLRLDVRDDEVQSITLQCRGTLRVVRTDVNASIGAQLSFAKDKTFFAPTQSTLSALGLQ